MKQGVLVAGALAALATLGWWAARRLPPTGVSGSPQARAQLDELRDILRSGNDNDPRLGRDFGVLGDETKRLFRAEYRRLPRESLSDRGVIAFLLGRNLRSAEDWDFLREAVLEPPCLSMADCSKRAAPSGGEEAAGDEVTLAYPPLMALKQVEHVLESRPGAKEARDLVAAAKGSKSPAVVRLAERLELKFIKITPDERAQRP